MDQVITKTAKLSAQWGAIPCYHRRCAETTPAPRNLPVHFGSPTRRWGNTPRPFRGVDVWRNAHQYSKTYPRRGGAAFEPVPPGREVAPYAAVVIRPVRSAVPRRNWASKSSPDQGSAIRTPQAAEITASQAYIRLIEDSKWCALH